MIKYPSIENNNKKKKHSTQNNLNLYKLLVVKNNKDKLNL